ncbi:hypothetical protein GCM10020000_37510 [Streptomyces olivoverticillatus]
MRKVRVVSEEDHSFEGCKPEVRTVLPMSTTADPLAALGSLPGVADSVDSVRKAVDRVYGHRVMRRRSNEITSEAALRGARGSAALSGADWELEEVRRRTDFGSEGEPRTVGGGAAADRRGGATAERMAPVAASGAGPAASGGRRAATGRTRRWGGRGCPASRWRSRWSGWRCRMRMRSRGGWRVWRGC